MAVAAHFFDVGGIQYVYDPADNGIYEIDLTEKTQIQNGTHEDQLGAGDCRKKKKPSRFLKGIPLKHFDAEAELLSKMNSGMAQLTLSVSENCNLRCRYCVYGAAGIGHRSHSKLQMSEATGRKAIDYFLDHSGDSPTPIISFYGGEPLLCESLVVSLMDYAISKCGERRPRFTIATNGVLLASKISDKTLAYLVKQQMQFQISLDGYAAIHNLHRRTASGNSTYNAVLAGIRRLIGLDDSYAKNILFSVTVASPSDIIKVSKFFHDFSLYRDLGIDIQPDVVVNRADLSGTIAEKDEGVAEWGRKLEEDLFTLRHEYVDACIAGQREGLSPVVKNLFDADMQRLYRRPRTNVSSGFEFGGCCVPGVKKLYVTASGKYQVCERIVDELHIGNTDSGLNIAKVHSMHSRYKAQFDNRCTQCWAVRLCRLCYTSLKESHDDTTVYDRHCTTIKKQLNDSLQSYVHLIESCSQTPDFLLAQRPPN